ncbi:MAG: PadR family transcriptional regulator [Acidimicrobiaceae bacterium]|nr:PadR family transcriptional regulator [Acidimicrobiaceae bacterium]MBO0746870.1 PadR family transcriptional regulator [Acidimicrobiaceae bacterium]
MLELAILGLLKEQQLHGYELKKRLVDTLGGPLSGVSFGSLYPALGRLERAGAVVVIEDPAVGKPIPLTGSLGGELAAFRARRPAAKATRGRKVYRITERGEQLFAELLATESSTAEDERQFNLRLAFARYLPPGARIGMLEHRRAQLVERLGRLSTRVRNGRDRLDSYARSLLEHDRETTEHDLSWIERLLTAEREAAIAPATVLPGPELSGEPGTANLTATSIRAGTPAPTNAGIYRPSLSGIRPRTSEENTTT